MTDLDMWKQVREERRQRHAGWYEQNLAYFKKVRPQWFHKDCKVLIQHDNVLLIREFKNLKVDFYPHTGRWKLHNKTYSGGAFKFFKWYEKIKNNGKNKNNNTRSK